MWHTTCTQGNQIDSWLLMVRSQTTNLTFGTSFDHNLRFKCPNELCKPISNIYVPKYFQWYKEHFNPMSFDPCNRSLKIWESTRTPTPKVCVPLGVWGFIPSHSFALLGAWNVTFGFPSCVALLQTLALVASPRLRLQHHVFSNTPKGIWYFLHPPNIYNNNFQLKSSFVSSLVLATISKVSKLLSLSIL
jgi:hypothetical protein